MLYATVARIIDGECNVDNLESKYRNENVTIQILSIIKTSEGKLDDPILITSNATSIFNLEELKSSIPNILLFGIINQDNELTNFDSPEVPLSTNLKQITLHIRNINHQIIKNFQGFLYIKIEYNDE